MTFKLPSITGTCLLFLAAAASAADVKPLEQWKGAVPDENLSKGSPDCIVSAKGMAALWGQWKLAEKPPEVDFEKCIVVLTTTRGSQLSLFLKLDDKGNLQVGGLGTFDLRPGFRYVMASVPKEGIKTVNKQALPKE